MFLLLRTYYISPPISITLLPSNLSHTVSKESQIKVYTTTVKKKYAFIQENSVISMYDIEESDIAKFSKLVESAQYIQSIESRNESKQKGKYFRITTKTDYGKLVKEVIAMVK